MKKPVKNKSDYIIDRQGTKWAKIVGYLYLWHGVDNFGGTYYRATVYPIPLRGIWNQ
jgi:hypothetical protein